MAYLNEFLMRDSLSDTGQAGHIGSYCSSPDMICHSIILNPQEVFIGNYATDPSERINAVSKTNPLYTRIKSMQSSAGEKSGYVRVYRAGVSLFMNVSQWQRNRLVTPKGSEYVTVKAGKNGDIGVADDIFLIDGTQPNFCLVGIVNDSAAETIPGNFNKYNDFVVWVNSNCAVAVRNFTVMSSGGKNDYEAMYAISNPESAERFGGIELTASNFPDGTLFGVECTPLRISKSSTYISSDPSSMKVSEGATLPALLDSYVQVYARLPAGTVWPPDAKLEAEFYISAEEREAMCRYSYAPEKVLQDVSVLVNRGSVKRLVRVGSCSTVFK